MNFYTKDTKTALESKDLAQWIAFGPVVFQVAKVLRDTGILTAVEESGLKGLTQDEIVEATTLPRYGVRVLLESGLGIGLVILNDLRYTLTKTGHFILHDPLTKVNMDFVQDVCYKGLYDLEASIRNGKPEGLKVFGNWPTIYEGLSQLPAPVQKSWFAFDHFFSDTAFPAVLKTVYKNGIRNILDIGGNTGKWAIASTRHAPDVHVTIMDLPGQLNVAKNRIAELGLQDRVSFHPANLLDETQPFPTGFDAIWMSQFLDCFSEDEIVSILKRCHQALDDNGYVLILEAFWDLQRFETAAFCLQQTSIYFTALANGNSQMYHSKVFTDCVRAAGFEITQQTDHIGLSHTLLSCKKKI
ncbi:methyltransferase [Dinghuibacter silviterrae]|uniref:O-methyltransferase n=1 Tax=Dinghuibacter silviterrae TaxID=1539049 RepID=A0A4V3GM68_9BACT|nr:methyltransferase [Dinghuibacter silviterrae]TDX02283.1 O-methyltransferase [Dinghuibacter silviterrae]